MLTYVRKQYFLCAKACFVNLNPSLNPNTNRCANQEINYSNLLRLRFLHGSTAIGTNTLQRTMTTRVYDDKLRKKLSILYVVIEEYFMYGVQKRKQRCGDGI